MTSALEDAKARTAWLFATGAAGVAALFYYLAQGSRSYIPDEGIYSFVGLSWLHGDWPYRDAWDHKGPLVYLAPAIRIALLGAEPEMLAIQEIFLGVACAGFVGAAAWRLWGSTAGAVALASGVMIWAQRPPAFGHMSSAGSVIALANAAGIFAIVCAWRARGTAAALRWHVLTGLLGGLAFCAKPNAPTCILVALLAVSLDSQRALIRALPAIALGFLLPVLTFAGLFFAVGALPELFDAVFVFNLSRGGAVIEGAGLLSLARTIVQQLARMGVLVLSAALTLVTVLALVSRRRRGRSAWIGESIEWVVPIWLALELAVFASNGAFTHHVYTVLPALALGVAWLLVGSDRAIGGAVFSVLAVLIVLIFGPMLFDAASKIDDARFQHDLPDWRSLAQWLSDNTAPDERVLAFTGWAEPGMLTLANRRSAVRYFHPPGLWAAGNLRNDPWREVVDVLEGSSSPGVMIISVWGLDAPVAGEETLDWVLGRLDHPLVHDLLRSDQPLPRIPRVKRLVRQRYLLDSCTGTLCVLRRKAEPSPKQTGTSAVPCRLICEPGSDPFRREGRFRLPPGRVLSGPDCGRSVVQVRTRFRLHTADVL